MRTILFIASILLILTNLSAQEKKSNSNPIFNSQGLTYDSVMRVIQNKSINFDQKNSLVREIDDISDVEKVSQVYRIMISQAKKIENKRYLSDLYCAVANNYLFMQDGKSAKQYLDSAFQYEKKLKDNYSALALMNYIMSRYYVFLGEEAKSHEYIYKTIGYFEKTEGKKSSAILLLYNLANAYAKHNDEKSMGKVKTQILALADEVKEVVSYINAYSVEAGYYQLCYQNTQDKHYLDSLRIVSLKIINIYEAADATKQNIVKGLLVQHYLNAAEAELYHGHSNIELSKGYVKDAKKILDETGPFIGKHTHLASYCRIKAKILFAEKKYKPSLESALQSVELMKQLVSDNDTYLYEETYNLLANIYEKLGNYAEALNYTRLKNEISTNINNSKKFAIIKDLDTKYEAEKKENRINKLKQQQQQISFRLTLTIVFSVSAIIILIAFLLYNKTKQLRKEAKYQDILKQTEIALMTRYLDGLESERARVSKELHDNVANNLFLLEQHLNRLNHIPESVSQQIECIYTHTRNLSHDLMIPSFQYACLPEIMDDYLQEIKERTNMLYHLQVEPEEIFENLPAALSHEIYRIVQECMSNIIKHSAARNTCIKLLAEENRIVLSIADDGVGFDIRKKTKGIGLTNIRSRCEKLNAQVQIFSEKGKGCEVRVSIPFNPIAADVSQ